MHFRNELKVWQICTYNSNKIALFAAPKLNKRAEKCWRMGGGAGPGSCRVFCCGKRIHSLALSGAAKRSATGTGRQAWLHSITYIHNRRHTHKHTHTVSFRRVLCNVHGQNCSKQIFINAQIEQITVFLYAHTRRHTHTLTHTCSLAY